MYGATVPLSDLETVAHAAAVRSPTCRYVRLAVAALLALTGTLAAALSLTSRAPLEHLAELSNNDVAHPHCAFANPWGCVRCDAPEALKKGL